MRRKVSYRSKHSLIHNFGLYPGYKLGVFIQQNGMLEWNGGMEWNGIVE